METIRNYLETMFLNLPGTPEVMRAKMELGQMMEDKYNELIAEGKMDNEATGIVISEFGNLEELAEELGILDYMKKGNFEKRETVTMETVRSFIAEKTRSSVRMAIGVLFCILSPAGFIFFQALTVSKTPDGKLIYEKVSGDKGEDSAVNVIAGPSCYGDELMNLGLITSDTSAGEIVGDDVPCGDYDSRLYVLKAE